MKINLVIPSPALKPSGGVKVMYEYANHLSAKGHQVTIIHGIKQIHKKMKSPLWYKRLLLSLKKGSQPQWFKFNKGVKSIIVPEISNSYIPDADVIMSTWWMTALEVENLDESKGKKFNLIQGYETWDGQAEKVHGSYKLSSQKLAVSKYLQQLVKEISGQEPIYIPNAVDHNVFYTTNPIENRKPASICMMYSNQEIKGSKFGLEALIELKKKIPELTVDFISVPKKPKGLPKWITYNRNPSNLREIYNRNSIFLSTSLNEGWGLTCTEAMLCSCSLLCTDIGGHREFAFNNKTALMVEPGNADQIYQALLELIENNEKRCMLAKNGQKFVSDNFSWAESTMMLEKAFLANVSG
jgi:glycosyltransferase involved in cell wall biosynthesis